MHSQQSLFLTNITVIIIVMLNNSSVCENVNFFRKKSHYAGCLKLFQTYQLYEHIFFVCIRTASVEIRELVLFSRFVLILCSISCLLVLYEYSKQNNICKNILFILYRVSYMVTSYNCCYVG